MVSSSIFKALLVSFALSGGASAACTRYIEAHQGDTCAILASAAGITVAQFLRSNPGVSSCSQLVDGGNYCIEGVADSAPQASTSTSSSRPSQTSSPGRLTISTDGNCGNGVTCIGSTFGNCCSQFGFCGATADYCLSEGCQTAFGLCGAGAISSSSAGPSITPPPGSTVTVTVTSVGAVTRTSLVYETRTTTTAATVLTTQTVRVTASTTVTNTVAQSVAITATATTTRTIQTVATVTSTVLQTSAAVITRTSTVPATSYDIITLTTIETKAITITSTTLRTSTTTTTTTRVIQTVIPVTETLTSIVTSVSTIFITVVTGACSATPTRPSLVTTTQASGGRPTPLLPGTPSNCRNFAVIREDDTCRTLSQRSGLTLLQFYDLNPSVGNDTGFLGLFCTPDLLDLLLSGLCQINCDQLWEGYYVCVGK